MIEESANLDKSVWGRCLPDIGSESNVALKIYDTKKKERVAVCVNKQGQIR